VAGVPFGLFLAQWIEWHAPFYFLGAIGCLVLAITVIKLPASSESSSPSDSSFDSFLYVVSQSNHWRAFSLMILLMFAGFTVIPYISPSLVANAKLPESQLPLIYFFGGICTFFSSPWFGRLTDRYGAQRVFLILASVSLVPILIITNLGPASVFWLILSTTLFMVFVGGRFVPAMALILSSVNPRYRASFMSLNTAIQQLSAGVASLLSAHLITQNSGRLENYSLVGVVAVVASLCAIVIARRVKTYTA
jgi:predicted MFS family arabinose efflux permease